MRKQKILIIDDEPDIRDVLKITLECEGFEVFDMAGDGAAVDVEFQLGGGEPPTGDDCAEDPQQAQVVVGDCSQQGFPDHCRFPWMILDVF